MVLELDFPGARRLRAGVALGPRQPRLAIVDLAGAKPLVHILGELPEGAAAVARDAVGRIGCKRAVVAPAPAQTELFLVARGALHDSEFESMLVLEAARFDLPFAPEDTVLASEVRARPNRGQVTVGAASTASVDAAMGVARDLGLEARAAVPDSLAYEALLKACGLGETERATIVLEVNPEALVFHAFDPQREVRGRRVLPLAGASDRNDLAAVIARELDRTSLHFERELGVSASTTVLVTSEQPLDLEPINERSGSKLVVLDARAGVTGQLPDWLPASYLRALGLALLRDPRIDLRPAPARKAERLELLGRGALLAGVLAATVAFAHGRPDRTVLGDARTRTQKKRAELSELEPRLRREQEVKAARARADEDRARLRFYAAPRVATAPLLEDLERLASPTVLFDRLSFHEDRVEIHGQIAAEAPREAVAAEAAFVERLEKSPRLANVALAPETAGPQAPFRFHAEAQVMGEDR
jgi:hypothetical protein